MQVIELQFFDYLLQPINASVINIQPQGGSVTFDITPTSSRHAIANADGELVYASWIVEGSKLIATGAYNTATSAITNELLYYINSLTKEDGTKLTKFKNYPQ